MSTPVSNVFVERFEQLKQKQSNISETVQIFEPTTQPILIRPSSKGWYELCQLLEKVVNLPGFMDTRVKELYEQGYGAELETAAEIALATAKKSPFHLFAAMISRKAGNWHTKTLKMVHDTWDARRHTREVMDKLKLKPESTKAILALAWRLKGSIMRFLGIATEQGVGIKNPTGLFFSLTKKPA